MNIIVCVFPFFQNVWGGGGGGGRGEDFLNFIIIKMASVFKLPDVNVYVCVWGGGGGRRNNVFTLLKRLFKKKKKKKELIIPMILFYYLLALL